MMRPPTKTVVEVPLQDTSRTFRVLPKRRLQRRLRRWTQQLLLGRILAGTTRDTLV